MDGGYIFYYTRKLEGVPITYTMDYGGGLEDMDSTVSPWGYEICNIIVGDDGIQEVEIINPYEIGAPLKENVKLMKFDEIIKIYEQMMQVINASMEDFITKKVFHIKTIKLGYTRIYDPKSDNTSGILVPVWDFFGGFDFYLKEGDSQIDSGDHSIQSFMTINAIDGSIINRSLGY